MAHTLRNPIYVSMQSGDYYIRDEKGDTVYKGRVDNIPGDNSTYTQVDLAPIFRQLVKPVDYSMYLQNSYIGIWDTNSVSNIIRKFTLVTPDDYENEFDLLWNYKYEYDLEDEDDYFWNYAVGVQDYLYEGQMFPVYVLNNGTEFSNIIIQKEVTDDINDLTMVTPLYNYAMNGASNHNFFLNTRVPFFNNNEKAVELKYVISNNEGQFINFRDLTPNYPVKLCKPKSTVTLYWLNLNGGLSWCHFDCKNIKSTNITRSQIEHNIAPNQYTKFGLDNYHVSSYNSYTLNTNFLTDEQSKRIQDLFVSPKVWMQIYDYDNLENGITISVVVTDNKVEEKNFKNDKMFNYTVNVRQSKSENIYA